MANLTCMNFDNFPWSDLYRRFSQHLNGLATALVCILGITGNLYSIRVVRNFRIGKALFYYLVTLALWDTALLLCALLYYAVQNVCISVWHLPKQMTYLTVYMNGPSLTSMTGSVWLVVAITVVRHSAISSPIKHRLSIAQQRALLVCIIISVSAIFYSLPYYFELTVGPCVTAAGQPWLQPDATKLRLSPAYQYIYRVACHFVFVSVLPFALILILTSRLIYLLNQSIKRKSTLFEGRRPSHLLNDLQSKKQQNSAESHTSGMLIVLLGKFLFCYLLSTVLNLVEAIGGAQVTVKVLFIILADLSNFLVVLNSATNAIVYFRWKQNLSGRFRSRTSTSTANLSPFQMSGTSTVEASRSPSFVLPAFSPNEKLLLLESWQSCHDSKKEQIGINLLAFIIRAKPALVIHLDVKKIDLNSLEMEPAVRSLGAKITDFLDSILKSVVELKCPADSFGVMDQIRKMINKHQSLGVNLPNDTWVLFKQKMIYEILGLEDWQFKDMISRSSTSEEVQRAKIWNQFLSLLVAEIKKTAMHEGKILRTGSYRTSNKGKLLKVPEIREI